MSLPARLLSTNPGVQVSTLLSGVAIGAGAPKLARATGGTISYDATNDKIIHTFTSSGNFIIGPSTLYDVEFLVVAGGGSGGNIDPDAHVAGGGGGGGARSTNDANGGGEALEDKIVFQALQNYTITVGAGGASGTSSSQGGSSSITGTGVRITTLGGARGRGDTNQGGAEICGSIGGASSTLTTRFSRARYGYIGGSGYQSGSKYMGGGGGGAGSAGESPNGTQGTNDGGPGITVSISGSSVTYAGGGGGASREATGATFLGGAGGSGGGGAGGGETARGDGDSTTALSRSGRAGTANTGGGGGGNHSFSGDAGAGGSGIVIIRYSAR